LFVEFFETCSEFTSVLFKSLALIRLTEMTATASFQLYFKSR